MPMRAGHFALQVGLFLIFMVALWVSGRLFHAVGVPALVGQLLYESLAAR